MKKHILFLWLLLAGISLATAQVNNQALVDQYNQNIKSSATISFEENKGQVKDQHWQPRPDVLFSGESNGLVYHIRGNGISYQLSRVESWKEEDDRFGLPKIDSMERRMIPDEIGIYRIDVNWLNANQNCEVVRGKALHGYTNYYNVPDGVEPALNVLKYEDIKFKNVWKGVDLHYFSRDGQLESDWIMEHAEDYSQIRFEVKGAELSIDEEGYLIMNTPFGEIREGRLKVFQNGKELQSEWVLNGNKVSFKILGYEWGKSLRIDPPTRIWGTYYGITGTVKGRDCALDSQNNIYIVGYLNTQNTIATIGSHQELYAGGGWDAFLVKFDSNGVRLWGTYYGGSSGDQGDGCATDSQNNIYLVGWTSSLSAISTIGSHQEIKGGTSMMSNAFLVKFNSNGVRQWGTYYGGSSGADARACATDSQNNIYLVGNTQSSNAIATIGAHQDLIGGSTDAFLVKFNANGVRLWGTYYGGTSSEFLNDCKTDSQNNIFIVGETISSNAIATIGAHQVTIGGGEDAYLVKFDSNGVRQWGTYYGGLSNEDGYGCATDSQNNIFITGVAYSTNAIATIGAHQPTGGGSYDAFLVKFDSNGVRQWGTYYGGGSSEYGYGCSTDSQNNIYLTGQTSSATAIATIGAYQDTKYGGADAFLAKFNSNGIRQWGTFYGGTGGEISYACRTDSQNNIFIVGETTSSNAIATVGAHQETIGGGSPAFLTKFLGCLSNLQASVTAPNGNSFCLGDSLILTANSGIGYNYQWLLNGQYIIGENNYNLYASQGGSYSVQIIDSTSCYSLSAAVGVTVNPLPSATITPSSSLSFCQGDSVTLSGTTGTGLTYQWKMNGTNIIGATTQAYVANQSGQYSVVVTNASNCSQTSANTTVTVNLLPTATISAGGTTIFCQGNNVLLSANTGAGLTYQWKRDGTNISGASSSTYSATLTGNYTALVTNQYFCQTLSSPIGVTVNPLPLSTITAGGPLAFCLGNEVTLNANTGVGLTYQWKQNGTPISSATTSSLIANQNGAYTVLVTDSLNCSKESTPANVTVHQPPTAVLTPNGATAFCYGDAVTLNANTGAGLSYQWFMNNMPFTNSQSSYIVTQPAGYHVVITNSYNCKDTSSIIQVIVHPLPSALVSVAGDHFCQGDTMWYSANVGLGLSYLWYRNGTALPTDTNSLFGATSSGQYYVVVTDINSCQKSSDTLELLNYIPYEGEKICAVTLDSATAKNLIVWEKAIGKRIMQYRIYREGAITGQYNLLGSTPYNAFSTFVDTGANPLQQSYRYKLSILDSCGNESSLSPMHKTNHLASNMGASGEINLQWTPYEGATYQTHKVLRSNAGSPFTLIGQVAGNMYSFTDLTPPIGQNRYFVEIEVDGGCTPTIGKGISFSTVQSNRVAMNVIGIPSIDVETHFRIYPNPAKDEVTIQSSVNLSDASYELLDILGRTVLNGSITSDETKINIGKLSTGVYLLTVSSDDRQMKQTIKLVVE